MAITKAVMLFCIKCKHRWWPRGPKIRICPNCKTQYWDKPKERKAKPGK